MRSRWQVLFPDDHLVQHIVNYLRGYFDEKHLSGQLNTLKSIQWRRKLVNESGRQSLFGNSRR